MDAVQRWALELILDEGASSSPRGHETREVLAAGFTLSDPRRRCITNPTRRWSLPLAVGEFAWHVSGSNDLTFLGFYAPRWRDFSEDSQTIRGSCYGRRVFGTQDGSPSQWELLIGILRHDPMSRRAILNFQQESSEALRPDSIDTACATILQFFLRDGKVHAVAYMRSNDVIWGLPYDVFLFTMLQEMLACEMGLEVGRYSHVAGSLHVYARHFDLARRIIASGDPEPFLMPMMTSLSGLQDFLDGERAVRGGILDLKLPATAFWGDLVEVLRIFALRRAADISTKDLQDCSPFRTVLAPVFADQAGPAT